MMKIIKIILLFSILIFTIKCDKKFLKIRECFTDEKIARLVRCEIVDGKFFVAFNVLSPVSVCMVSFVKNFLMRFIELLIYGYVLYGRVIPIIFTDFFS